ncbi:tRNA (guanine-N1)-methyltransferase, partial [Campylobacter coli]|nr:tRNA (guanine-N1)-methyltransferase [Campylobacter coli]
MHQRCFFNLRKFMKFSFVSLFPNLLEFYFKDS